MTLVARRYHSKKIRDIGKYRRLGHVLIGESNVAIVPAIGRYGVEDIYLGDVSPQGPTVTGTRRPWASLHAG